MTSLPRTRHHAPFDVHRDEHTRAMSQLDGCPQCVHNTETPIAAVSEEPGWTCTYRCNDCGHLWNTSWAVV